MKKANDDNSNNNSRKKIDLRKLHQYADKPHAADVVKFEPAGWRRFRVNWNPSITRKKVSAIAITS